MNFWTFLDRNAPIVPLLALFMGGALLGSCAAAAHAYEVTHSCGPVSK